MAGTEALNSENIVATSGDSSELKEPKNSKLLTLPVAGKDTVGKAAAIDTVKTLYSSAVGVMGLGKLARTNISTTSATHKVDFDDAKSTSADLKAAESSAHNGTLYSTTLAAIDTKKVVGVPNRVAVETEKCHKSPV